MAELPKITNPILAVLQTPWHADETLDLETLEREIAWLFDCGANGIVMAMVSETLRMDTVERQFDRMIAAT